jgi:hypothetical protein
MCCCCCSRSCAAALCCCCFLSQRPKARSCCQTPGCAVAVLARSFDWATTAALCVALFFSSDQSSPLGHPAVTGQKKKLALCRRGVPLGGGRQVSCGAPLAHGRSALGARSCEGHGQRCPCGGGQWDRESKGVAARISNASPVSPGIARTRESESESA